jgi:RecA/RadA recombinase
MSPLIKRQTSVSDQVIQEIANPTLDTGEEASELALIQRALNVKKTISSGSTLLDLAVSGGVNDEGGIPGGIFLEYFGPSGAGKTALLSELAASAQSRGGEVRFCDPEARLDQEYSKIYGVNINQDFEYYRPDTVASMFGDYIWPWSPKNPEVINLLCSDSIAALSTDLEMDNDDGDKMGMRRAKEFSEGLRKTCRLIARNQWLIAFSNQIRTGEGGKTTTPGGFGIPFYASLRIQVKPGYPKSKITKKIKFNGVEIEKIIGVLSDCFVFKSSVDEPYRSAPISVIFGYGIDDIRDQLQFYKDMTKGTSYDCIDKTYVAMENAIEYIEQCKLQRKLKLRTIALWREIQEKFKVTRLPKRR